MSALPTSPGQWPQVASRWHLLGPPLRPVEADLDVVRAAVGQWAGGSATPPRGLILGVTPELHDLPWPPGSDVRAVDRTSEMLTWVWPGEPAAAVHADWREMTWPDDSFDVVVCDGGWHLLDLPGQQRLAETLGRTLAPGGIFVVRLFAPPDEPETPERVLDDLLAGRIRDLNVLKLRMAMAMTASPVEGVRLGDVWQRVHDAAGPWTSLAPRLGWDLDHLGALDAYRGSSARYHFVGVDRLVDQLAAPSVGLDVETVVTPEYVLGERCPTVVARRPR